MHGARGCRLAVVRLSFGCCPVVGWSGVVVVVVVCLGWRVYCCCLVVGVGDCVVLLPTGGCAVVARWLSGGWFVGV